MLTKEYQVTIHVLRQQGMSARAIARELNIARQTVLDVLSGRNDGKYGPRMRPATKLAPFHEYISTRVQETSPARLAATVLYREIQEQGYGGGLTRLRTHLASIRTPCLPDPIQRFETNPGQQMQIDFVVFRRGDNPLRAFTATLGYSRMSFVHFTDNERAETWAQCLQHSFEFFGGVPKSILCDNAKSIVIQRNAYGEGQHRLHSLMWDLAKHYGLRVYLCQPYRAQTKGKVERFHRYLRQSFFIPTQSRLSTIPIDVDTANREVRIWLDTVANTRIHATLKEKPCDRFAREKNDLQPLPLPYGGVTLRTISAHASSHVQVPMPIESLQHPLSAYETLAQEIHL